MAADIWGTANRDEGPGSDGADGGPMELSNIVGAGDPGDAVVTSIEDKEGIAVGI